jgi:hypothetical protein
MIFKKGVHLKTRLDEHKVIRFKSFIIAHRDSYVKMMDDLFAKSRIPKIIFNQPSNNHNYIGPKPAHINPFFGLNSEEKEVLKKRIKLFKKESTHISDGMEKFRQAVILGIPYSGHQPSHLMPKNSKPPRVK